MLCARYFTSSMTRASVNIARLLYVLICECFGVALALITKGVIDIPLGVGLLGGLVVAGFFIFVETLMKGYSLRGFSNAVFGLLIGVFCAWLMTRVHVSDLIQGALTGKVPTTSDAALSDSEILARDKASAISLIVETTLYASLGFIGVVLSLRSSPNDFAFILPYVRFRQEGSTGQPILLDAECIMDGRVAAVVETGFLHGRLIVPRFVLDELQKQSTSAQGAQKLRAERGLEILHKMQTDKNLQLTIEDAGGPPGESVHDKLMHATQLLGARLMTSDMTLTKVAKLRGLEVLNLEQLGEALKPDIVIGQQFRVPLIRTGKDEHQAVGYLPDGTMLVVNHSAHKIGTTQLVQVISTHQTHSGMLVFAEMVS
jgi:uncharacterized protein YacL